MSTAIKARPTLYRGIQMRSRLEASYAAYLDSTLKEISWEYEPQCFASKAGQYLPDFRLTFQNGKFKGDRIYLEVKPESIQKEQLEEALNRMPIVWESEPDAVLVLAFAIYDGGSFSEIIGNRSRQLWILQRDHGKDAAQEWPIGSPVPWPLPIGIF